MSCNAVLLHDSQWLCFGIQTLQPHWPLDRADRIPRACQSIKAPNPRSLCGNGRAFGFLGLTYALERANNKLHCLTVLGAGRSVKMQVGSVPSEGLRKSSPLSPLASGGVMVVLVRALYSNRTYRKRLYIQKGGLLEWLIQQWLHRKGVQESSSCLVHEAGCLRWSSLLPQNPKEVGF